MKKAIPALMASLFVAVGMHAADANAGPFKFRFFSGHGHPLANENSLASFGKSESNSAHDEHGGGNGSPYDPFDLISTLGNESNDGGQGPLELPEFESPQGGITKVLDIPVETEVSAQAIGEPSTVALLLAPIGLLLTRRAIR